MATTILVTHETVNQEIIMSTRHDEHCRKCKAAILALLIRVYGGAVERQSLGMPADLNGYENREFYPVLKEIYSALQKHRGFKQFVRTKNLQAVDYYVPRPSLVIEFDESQHFTAPRELTLRMYPASLKLGFARDLWVARCTQLNRMDNDPPYRDEQRAWYDALRDFASHMRGVPLIRILPDERVWCQLDPDNGADVAWFGEFVESRLRLWKGEGA